MSEGKYERTYLINVGAQFKYHESQKFKTISTRSDILQGQALYRVVEHWLTHEVIIEE